jgi:nitric oxide dioxygenase
MARPTAAELCLVRDSFNRLRPIADFLAAQFYQRLFELAPDTKFLFKQTSAQQYRMLMSGLATLIREADDENRFDAFARELAVKHTSYGVTPQHYRAATEALLDTVRQALGAAFTREVKGAWTTFCGNLFEQMQTAVANDR